MTPDRAESGPSAADPRFAARTEAPDDTERPRLLLARYIHNLLSLALEAQKGDNAEAKQLDLCRRILDRLIAKDTGLGGTDHLIPLGAGDLLVNARGEPALGQILQTEIRSAARPCG